MGVASAGKASMLIARSMTQRSQIAGPVRWAGP